MAQNGNNRGPNDGPPDLDEVFRQLNDKLSRLLGGKPRQPQPPSGGGGGPRLGGGMRFGAAGLLMVLGGLWLASGFYVVDAREEGVVLRLGSYHRTSDSGLQWHAPWPFEEVEIVNLTQLRSVEIGYRSNAKNRVPEESLMLTQDQNIIDVQLSVQYDVKDARDFLFNNLALEDDAQDVVKQAAETAIREVVGRSKVDFVLNEGRGQVAAETQASMQQILDHYHLGVRVAKVNINDVQPPEAVIAAFDDAVKAGQDKEKLRNDGLAYANDVVPKAQGLAARLLQEAEGYKQKVVSTAEGDASRFQSVLTEYSKAPKVMRDRLYLDMMQQVLSNSSKVYVDQKSGSNLLYLPLDKLMQQAGADKPATAVTVPQADTPATQAPKTHADRDVTRGR
ncbi:FtsH protease activity modulator HflK [Vogesella sp. LIG4]|uniref:FtsH protease activity modulator HflK n=1 Tax=Vogesella sp. LIG4 TaxID=1192162 RepID=UPI00081FFD7D|nr:FtsH protease activity modulator HflK [Vogesella sp. LIG4]SCK20232.1 membrane protease subunit HflK [Vogesella sp. LIG4]